MDAQQAAQHPLRKLLLMLGNERVLHFAAMAKYAAAFIKMACSSVIRASSFLTPDLLRLVIALDDRRRRKLLPPLVEGKPAHTQPLRNFGNGIAPFRDLTHRVSLTFFAEI
jgi:hypothetical protein